KENLKIFETILDGERGPKRDIVLINAAYALYIANKAKSINEGLGLARESIDSGKARKKLEDLKNFTERIPLVNKGNLN
ncbi:MAG: anthranilate phosphoribosyltransferase, partial [Candidatus Omnitrophica bacterium]|nr:anthranilate phosphoribosyltransferase [Candidatus Omnitrophota bacterium]